MKSIKLKTLLLISTFLLSNGCATIFKGYEDDVSITRLPQNTRVYSQENIEIPILNKTQSQRWSVPGRGEFDSIQVVKSYILLRSNRDHILLFKNQDQERKIHIYPHLSAGWFILDLISGTFFVDLYTGNWNHFNGIDFTNIK